MPPLFHPKIATQWNQDGKDRVKPDEKAIAFNQCNSKTAILVVDLSSALEVMNVIMAQRSVQYLYTIPILWGGQ